MNTKHEANAKLIQISSLRYQHVAELGNRLTSDESLIGELLKVHLFAEFLLEELVRIALEENADAVLSLRLTFDQKVSLASKLMLGQDIPLIEESVIASLRKLNSLRNKAAHRYNSVICLEDILPLFVGRESELPYHSISEGGAKLALSRYAAFLFGNMLPKF